MLTDKELQSLRNLGNEAEAAADEIERLRAELLREHADHKETLKDVATMVAAERERCAAVARRWGETHADGETVNARNAGSKIARAIEWPSDQTPTDPKARWFDLKA